MTIVKEKISINLTKKYLKETALVLGSSLLDNFYFFTILTCISIALIIFRVPTKNLHVHFFLIYF